MTDCKHELVISKWYGTNTTLTATEFICTKSYNLYNHRDIGYGTNIKDYRE